MKAPKLIAFIPVTDPKIAKASLTIRFMHDVPDKDGGTVYWLEGKIEKRITKLSRDKKLRYVENHFRVGELDIVSKWGEPKRPLPKSVCTNLTRIQDGPC